MKFFRQLFGLGSSVNFELRYNKREEQWQVFKEDRIMYLGSKEACEVYIQNITSQ